MTENTDAAENSSPVPVNTDAGENIVGVIDATNAECVHASAHDVRVATDTTPILWRSAYDTTVQVDTTPVARMEPVTTSAPDSSAAAGPSTSAE
jgi:hypothetical protein